LECFEVLNPKMFPSSRTPIKKTLPPEIVEDLRAFQGRQPLRLGYLQVVRKGEAPFNHFVTAVPKCPARLLDEGFSITP